MMHIPRGEFMGGAEFAYTTNDLYQAIKLPYGNEAYLMTVILPQEDKTIEACLTRWMDRTGNSTGAARWWT